MKTNKRVLDTAFYKNFARMYNVFYDNNIIPKEITEVMTKLLKISRSSYYKYLKTCREKGYILTTYEESMERKIKRANNNFRELNAEDISEIIQRVGLMEDVQLTIDDIELVEPEEERKVSVPDFVELLPGKLYTYLYHDEAIEQMDADVEQFISNALVDDKCACSCIMRTNKPPRRYNCNSSGSLLCTNYDDFTHLAEKVSDAYTVGELFGDTKLIVVDDVMSRKQLHKLSLLALEWDVPILATMRMGKDIGRKMNQIYGEYQSGCFGDIRLIFDLQYDSLIKVYDALLMSELIFTTVVYEGEVNSIFVM